MIRQLFFIPSAYGLLFWTLSGALYLARLLPWERPDTRTLKILALVPILFATSLVLQLRRGKLHIAPLTKVDRDLYIEIAFHAIGLIGLGIYFRDMAAVLGGFNIFVAVAVTASYMIRWAAGDSMSIGTQLSYFGWVAAAVSIASLRQNPKAHWRYVLVLAQLLGNLLFIDRTRPVWIGFCVLLVALSVHGLPSRRVIIRTVLIVPAVTFAIFIGIGSWIGKIPDQHTYGSSDLPPQVQNAVVYLTSGFAYLNRMLSSAEPVDYRPVRTMSPAVNALAALRITERAPSQVNEEYPVPFLTNVGTFCEPFFRDGGMFYLLIGMIIQIFLVDMLCQWLLQEPTPFCRFAAAVLCFTSAVAFFTPKITTTPVWLFTGLAVLEWARNRLWGERTQIDHAYQGI